MKILTAKNRLPDIKTQVEQLNVNDIMFIPDLKWMEKRKKPLYESLEKNGMIYPIIVTSLACYWHQERNNWPKDETGNFRQGMACTNGNKRLLYAKENNYDKIEAYVVKNKHERDAIIVNTYMHPTGYPK
jgi:hypothetical protein